MPSIDTLVSDIHALFGKEGHTVSEANLDEACSALRTKLKEYLEVKQSLKKQKSLRMSALGTKDRRLWFEWNRSEGLVGERDPDSAPGSGENFMRFLMGSVTEIVLLFLAKEAGHKIEYQQEELELDGVPGHPDAVIDDHVVDLKTASHWQFPKFSEGKLFIEDDFGYLYQISAYRLALMEKYPDLAKRLSDTAYFWAYNKSNSQQALLPVTEFKDIKKRIKRAKEVVVSAEPPPEKCWEPQPYGTSGNKVLHRSCTYCPFKTECWKDANNGHGLRVFEYSGEYKFFTEVHKEPTVREVAWK